MTFNICGFEVTILAKKAGEKYYNGPDTKSFLLRLAAMAWSAADHNKAEGYAATAEECKAYGLALGEVITQLEEVEE